MELTKSQIIEMEDKITRKIIFEMLSNNPAFHDIKIKDIHSAAMYMSIKIRSSIGHEFKKIVSDKDFHSGEYWAGEIVDEYVYK